MYESRKQDKQERQQWCVGVPYALHFDLFIYNTQRFDDGWMDGHSCHSTRSSGQSGSLCPFFKAHMWFFSKLFTLIHQFYILVSLALAWTEDDGFFISLLNVFPTVLLKAVVLQLRFWCMHAHIAVLEKAGVWAAARGKGSCPCVRVWGRRRVKGRFHPGGETRPYTCNHAFILLRSRIMCIPS